MEPLVHDMTDEELQEKLMAEAVRDPLLQLFRFLHLPPHLRGISRQFAEVAYTVATQSEPNPERSTCFRKLRESKDCAVTAHLWEWPSKS